MHQVLQRLVSVITQLVMIERNPSKQLHKSSEILFSKINQEEGQSLTQATAKDFQ